MKRTKEELDYILKCAIEILKDNPEITTNQLSKKIHCGKMEVSNHTVKKLLDDNKIKYKTCKHFGGRPKLSNAEKEAFIKKAVEAKKMDSCVTFVDAAGMLGISTSSLKNYIEDVHKTTWGKLTEHLNKNESASPVDDSLFIVAGFAIAGVKQAHAS